MMQHSKNQAIDHKCDKAIGNVSEQVYYYAKNWRVVDSLINLIKKAFNNAIITIAQNLNSFIFRKMSSVKLMSNMNVTLRK